MGLSKLARLKSWDSSHGEIFWKDQEKSFLSRAVEVMKRPRPRSPTKPSETVGMGVGLNIIVGSNPPSSLDFGETKGDKRVLGAKIKYNRREEMIIRKNIIKMTMMFFLSSLVLGACGVDKSGVEIVSKPMAKVYLNGVESGMTPYKNNTLKSGEIEIKLDDGGGNFWERKIKLENNVTSVINWNFEGNIDNGYILSMEKTGENGSILVNSNPGGAMIYIDGELKTSSPAKIEGVDEGDRKLSISYPSYKSLNLIVKVVSGYQLIIDTKLEKEGKTEIINTVSPMPTQILGPKIKIKETETGWLRIRDTAGNNGIEVGRAKPGETYELISESNGWYQIKFGDKNAFVSAKYAEKI